MLYQKSSNLKLQELDKSKSFCGDHCPKKKKFQVHILDKNKPFYCVSNYLCDHFLTRNVCRVAEEAKIYTHKPETM